MPERNGKMYHSRRLGGLIRCFSHTLPNVYIYEVHYIHMRYTNSLHTVCIYSRLGIHRGHIRPTHSVYINNPLQFNQLTVQPMLQVLPTHHLLLRSTSTRTLSSSTNNSSFQTLSPNPTLLNQPKLKLTSQTSYSHAHTNELKQQYSELVHELQ